MGPFLFSLLWTILTCYLALFAMDGASPFERSAFTLFPLIGLLMTWLSWKRWRRWRTLRTETVDGVTFHVWIELDGSWQRSACDPRPDWESEDGDSGGDGGGD